VIVSSGGVSVGGHDLVKDVFAQRGDVDFWRVAVRPGKPFAFGRWDRRFFFGLPGNPASSMVTFELFVRPALRRLAGHSQLVRSVRTATLAEPISHQPGRRSFLRAITRYELGRFLSTPAGSQGSHLIGPLVSANSLIILPEEVACLDAGALVQAMLLREVD